MNAEFIRISREGPLRLKTSSGVLYELRPQPVSYRKVSYGLIFRSKESRDECEVYQSYDSGHSWKLIPWKINWWPHRLRLFSSVSIPSIYWPPEVPEINGAAIINDELVLEYRIFNTEGKGDELPRGWAWEAIYWVRYKERKMEWTIEVNRSEAVPVE
jgi:hypothetical protein